jgi:hypothetical protein
MEKIPEEIVNLGVGNELRQIKERQQGAKLK